MRHSVFVMILLWSQITLANGSVYSEAQYVNDVLQQSLGLSAIRKDIEAAQTDERQVDLQTATQWSASSMVLYDRRPLDFSTASYKYNSGLMLSTSLAQQTSTGTQLKLSLDVAQNHYQDLSFSPLAPKQNIDLGALRPSFEVSQPLWKNAMGRNIELMKASLKAGTTAQQAQLEAKKQSISLEARLTYSRLMLARERVKIATRTLETAKKINNYVKNKRARNLSEESDLLQSEGMLASRQIDLTSAMNEEEDAALAFNGLLGTQQRQVAHTLDAMNRDASRTTPLYDVKNRKEWLVIQAQMDGLDAQRTVEEEQTLPDLSLFGSVGLATRDDTFWKAAKNINDPFQPAASVGVKLTMTLDRQLLRSKVDALVQRKGALQQRREELDQNLRRELADLLSKREHALAVLKLSENLESLQRKKLTNEEGEHRNGRSTTYQLLVFTQDLAQSETGRIQALFELHRLQAMLMPFAEEKS